MSEWKWVPVEPTPEMLDATWGDERVMAADGYNQIRAAMYRAMLDAAPPPAADAVTDAMVEAAQRYVSKLLGGARMPDDYLRGIIAAAFAARGGR